MAGLTNEQRANLLDAIVENIALHRDIKTHGADVIKEVTEAMPKDTPPEVISKFKSEFVQNFSELVKDAVRKGFDNKLADDELVVLHSLSKEHEWLLPSLLPVANDISIEVSSALDNIIVSLLGDEMFDKLSKE